MEKLEKETNDIWSLHQQLTISEKQTILKVCMLFEIGQILTEIVWLLFFYTRFMSGMKIQYGKHKNCYYGGVLNGKNMWA
jgi:hypothetical protein